MGWQFVDAEQKTRPLFLRKERGPVGSKGRGSGGPKSPASSADHCTPHIAHRQGEKTHLNPYGSSSSTRGAPTWTCVMGKVGGSESRLFGDRQAGVEGAEMIHQAQVGGNGGARGFSNGRLIHLDHAVDGLSAVDRFPARIFSWREVGWWREEGFLEPRCFCPNR